jgi:hypothetical protein
MASRFSWRRNALFGFFRHSFTYLFAQVIDIVEDCGWDAGGLPCPGWRFDEEVWSALQGGEKLRQNRIHRE